MLSVLGEIAARSARGNGTSCSADAATDAIKSPSSARMSRDVAGVGGITITLTMAAVTSGAAAQTYTPPTAKTDHTIIATRSHATSESGSVSAGRSGVVVVVRVLITVIASVIVLVA